MTEELLLVKPNGEHRLVDNTYESIKEALDGATLDIVPCGAGECSFFVDDEGMLNERVFNTVASIMTGRVIFGPAVLCGPPDRDGDTMAPDERTFTAVHHMATIWAQVCDDAVRNGQMILPTSSSEGIPSPQIVMLDNDEFDAWLRGER